jgi:colicin import membrane protein
MNNPSQWEGPLVGRLAGKVILSMTPHRAKVLANAIWLADRTQWLDQLADDLSTAADQRDVFADEDPQRESADQRLLPPSRRQPPAAETAGPVDVPSQPAGSTANDVLFQALARDVEVEIKVAQRLAAAASQAASLAFEAVAAAAERTAHAAEAASDVQAVATARSAAAIAETVRQTATAVRLRADEEADRVANAASDLASRLALSPSAAHDTDAVARATMVAAGVSAAAVAIAQDVALHATVVARAAADAAMEAAAAAADAAMALELTVRSTAADVQTVAALTARRVAGETEKAADAVLASR